MTFSRHYLANCKSLITAACISDVSPKQSYALNITVCPCSKIRPSHWIIRRAMACVNVHSEKEQSWSVATKPSSAFSNVFGDFSIRHSCLSRRRDVTISMRTLQEVKTNFTNMRFHRTCEGCVSPMHGPPIMRAHEEWHTQALPINYCHRFVGNASRHVGGSRSIAF